MGTSKAKIISISLPPDVHEEIQILAREERRSISEIFREALRQYVAGQTVGKIRKELRKKNGRKLTENDIERIIDEGRV